MEPAPLSPFRLAPLLARLLAGHTLSSEEAEAAFATIMENGASDAEIGALLMGLAMRGETRAELIGAAQALRARMRAVPGLSHALDVCGTGGDQAGTLNVSTAVAFVVAGCGVPVAKHGNRSASSRSGGADVLAALGVRLDPPLARLPAILQEAGIVFLFAPAHHPALAHAAPVRRALGVRTLFNLLGPLANPGAVRHQLCGVYDPRWLQPMAEAAIALGAARIWTVHGMGLDELTLAGPNQIVAADRQGLRHFTLEAGSLGLQSAPVSALQGGDASENAACLGALLECRPSAPASRARAYRDTVLLNAAAALVAAGHAPDLAPALVLARDSLGSGRAADRLARLRTATLRPA